MIVSSLCLFNSYFTWSTIFFTLLEWLIRFHTSYCLVMLLSLFKRFFIFWMIDSILLIFSILIIYEKYFFIFIALSFSYSIFSLNSLVIFLSLISIISLIYLLHYWISVLMSFPLSIDSTKEGLNISLILSLSSIIKSSIEIISWF